MQTSFKNLNVDLKKEAKEFVNEPNIISSKIVDEEMIKKIIEITKQSIMKFNRMSVICNNIIKDLNDEFGTQWHCIASHSKVGESFIAYQYQRSICLEFGKMTLQIFKTPFVSKLKKNLRIPYS